MAREDGNPEEFRMVLVGDNGSGKSATGNTILGKRAFATRQSQDTETLTCQMERGEFEGTTVSMVDTPWSIRRNTTEMSKCISYCAPGPHAFLLVIPLKRFTDVEQQVKNLQWLVGEEASRYTIVLFTCGDELPDGVTAEEFIHQNPFPYGGGYHVFNNRDEDPSQVRELLEKINSMVQRNGGSYSIKVKNWKHKYLYPFARAVTIGGSIGAASGGTGLGVLLAVVGFVIGAFAAAGGAGNIAVAAATVGAVAGAVTGAGLIAVSGFEVLALVVGLSASLGMPNVGLALVVFGYVGRISVVAGGLAVLVALVDAGVVAATMGQDALGIGVAIGAQNAARAAAAIFAGADTVGATYQVFDDNDEVGIWEIVGILGGAAVGAGMSAANRVHAHGPDVPVDLYAAGLAVVIGVILVLAASGINWISGLAVLALVSVGAAIGAAAGVLGASGFAIGVTIYIACQTVTRWLKKKA